MRLALRSCLLPALSAALVAAGTSAGSAQPPLDVELTEIPYEFPAAANLYFGRHIAFDGARIGVSCSGRIDVYAWDGASAAYEATAMPGVGVLSGYGESAFSLEGNVLVASVQRADGVTLGAVLTFERQPDGTWPQTGRYLDMDTCCNSGVLAAAVDIEGPRVALGAPYFGGGFGSAILMRADASGDFAFIPGRYTRYTTSVGSLFAFDIDLRGDELFAGNLGYRIGSGENHGAAHLFRDTGSALEPILTIPNPTPAAHDQFGYQIESDGDFLYASARYDDTAAFDAGAVYVFDRAGVLQQTLLGPDAYARFGGSFAVDGDWMVVGAPAFALPPESPHLGSVTFYRRDASGVWRDRGRTSMVGGELGTHFGDVVRIRGNVAIVAAPSAAVGSEARAGRVWTALLTEPNGGVCASDGECTSGACVEGICCDRACDGACEACTEAVTGETDGTCAPVADGTDPNDACAESGCLTGVCSAGACMTMVGCDAGMPDAGTDAGFEEDAGSEQDAGSQADAGSSRDAGSVRDGSVRDAGSVPDGAGGGDAGQAVPRVPFSCTCRAGAGRSGSAWLLGASLLLGLALVRRRR